MPRKRVVRIGSSVVVRPGACRVVKVGYEHDFYTFLKQVSDAEDAETSKIDALLITKPGRMRAFISEYISAPNYAVSAKAINLVAKGLAYELTHRLNAQERKIFFGTPVPEGPARRVIDKKAVRVGKHYPARNSYSYDGDYDYEPGGLENAKTYVVLKLLPASWNDYDLEPTCNDYNNPKNPFRNGLWILQTDTDDVQEKLDAN